MRNTDHIAESEQRILSYTYTHGKSEAGTVASYDFTNARRWARAHRVPPESASPRRSAQRRRSLYAHPVNIFPHSTLGSRHSPMRSWSFSRLVGPTTGAVTPSLCISHARLICAMLTPFFFANSSTLYDVYSSASVSDSAEHPGRVS